MFLVLQMAQANPFANLNAIAAEVAAPDEEPVSRYTVRRRLAEAAIHSRLAATRFHLTDTHKANRLLYAQEALSFEEDYWDEIKFSDEKTFRSDMSANVYVRR